MKHEIDQFFKEKFEQDDGERFQYKEAYWDAMETLIEAEEAQRRRKRMLWLYSTGFCVLLLTGIAVSIWWVPAPTTPIVSKAIQPSTGHANSMNIAPATQMPQKQQIQQSNQIVEAKSAISEPRKDKSVQESSATDGATAEKSMKRQKQSKVSEKAVTHTVAALTKTKLNNGRPSMQDRPADLSVGANAENQSIVEVQTEAASVLSEQVTTDNVIVFSGYKQFLALLPLADMPVAASAELPVIAVPALTKPVQGTSKLFMGVIANAALYSNANQPLGWSVYAFAQQHLRGGWAVQAAIGLRQRQLNYKTTGGNVQDPAIAFRQDVTTYGFGFNRLQTTSTLRYMLALEMPVSIQYHRPRWYAEAGLSAGRLQSLFLEQTQFRSTSLSMDITTIGTSNTVASASSASIQQWYASPFVGAAWRITPGLCLNTRLSYYQLLVKPLNAPANIDLIPIIAGPAENISMDIGLIFTLNRKKQ